MSWIELWNGPTPIYVSAQHQERHYRLLAEEMAEFVGTEDVVIDIGCGEALSADIVAACCRRLWLCESASTVRQRLADRFASAPNIKVCDETLPDVAAGEADLIIANSVLQYLTREDVAIALNLWRGKLKPGGRLILGDVLQENTSALHDAGALLSLAMREGFLGAALLGLARTSFSEYARLRKRLGLLRFAPDEILALLASHGFSAQRRARNIGHNQQRMTFLAHAL